MKSYPVSQLAAAMNASLPQGGGEVVISGGVSTDTRSIPEEALFFALRGENFDAHNFLDQAVKAGAAALVIDKADAAPAGVPVLLVDDVLAGLQRLAHWYCAQLGIPVIAITGSNGKTSTKDLTRAVLSQKFAVNATKGNFNNHIGLPLTVLSTEEDHEVGIFEMGMSNPGEIAPLCQIAPPDISIITNVGSAHIENMGSKEAIAEEKGEVAKALKPAGSLLVPANCEFVEYYKDRTSGRVVPVGNGRGVVRAENLQSGSNGSNFDLVIDGQGRIPASIPVTGRHMVSNAMLAAAAGHVMGLSLEEIAVGLSSAELTSGRLRQFASEWPNLANTLPLPINHWASWWPPKGWISSWWLVRRLANLPRLLVLPEWLSNFSRKPPPLPSGLNLILLPETSFSSKEAALPRWSA